MISLLGQSRCSIFYAQAVEDACWWLPLMTAGQKCLGAPAVRPNEFVGVLDQSLEEIRVGYIAGRPKRLQNVVYDDASAPPSRILTGPT
jgi:hypothetical protein